MTNSSEAVTIANILLFHFGMAGVLTIVSIGWLRTRQLGYLMLAAWALTTMMGMAINFLPQLQTIFGKSITQEFTIQTRMWINLLRTVVSTVLLLTGLGLLVFGKPRASSPPVT